MMLRGERFWSRVARMHRRKRQTTDEYRAYQRAQKKRWQEQRRETA